MKCGEPKPGGSYETCDKELKHSGSHSYLGLSWPRPEPAQPNWDVSELLDNQTPRDAWGVMERSFPIIVTETVTRVIWVEAEDEDRALAHYGDDWSEVPLKDAEVLCADLEFERPDQYQRQDAIKASGYGRKIGPLVSCPGCGAEAFRREWMHKPLRKCHGPIEWRETSNINPQWRWRREYRTTPVYDAARQAVTA